MGIDESIIVWKVAVYTYQHGYGSVSDIFSAGDGLVQLLLNQSPKEISEGQSGYKLGLMTAQELIRREIKNLEERITLQKELL